MADGVSMNWGRNLGKGSEGTGGGSWADPHLLTVMRSQWIEKGKQGGTEKWEQTGCSAGGSYIDRQPEGECMRCNYYLISCYKCRHHFRQIANIGIFIIVSKKKKSQKDNNNFLYIEIFFHFQPFQPSIFLTVFPFRVMGGLEALPAQWLRAKRGC